MQEPIIQLNLMLLMGSCIFYLYNYKFFILRKEFKKMTKQELKALKKFAVCTSKKLSLPEPKISHDFSKCPLKDRGIGWEDSQCTIYVKKEDTLDFNLFSDVAYLLRRIWQVNNDTTFEVLADSLTSLTGDEIDGLAFAWCMMGMYFDAEPSPALPVTTIAIVMNRMREIVEELFPECLN